MNLLQDVINYVRRIVKTPSNSVISDDLIIDYINRFWLLDVDARVQLFDLKTKYGFQCTANITSYNMPLYGINSNKAQFESGNQAISSYPVYQGLMDPCFVNGIQIPFYTSRDAFYKVWTPYVQTLNSAGTGDGTAGPYTIALPFFPALRGHIDIDGIIKSGTKVDPIVGTQLNDPAVVQFPPPITSLYPGTTITAIGLNKKLQVATDSGQFLESDQDIGFLQTTVGETIQAAGTVNYINGEVTVTFAEPIALGTTIQSNSYFYEPGIPRAMMFYDNVITILPPPNISYYIEADAYLSPAAFLTTSDALPFAYMSEYLARGAARKILSDTGDVEQFMFYEPLFKEQETLVWKRSQRQFTATRTGTIFSDLQSQNTTNSYGVGSV